MAVALGAAVFGITPWGSAVDRFALDALFGLRGAAAPSNKVVIVAVDEPSFAEVGKQWPWPRSQHARLIDTLLREGARAVALDILFAEPADAAEDEALQSALEKGGGAAVLAMDFNVQALPQYIRESRIGPTDTILGAKTRFGNINFKTDDDGFIRRMPGHRRSVRSFAEEAATAYAPDCCSNTVYPPHYERLINYRGPPGTIPTVSYYQAIDADQYLPDNYFRDKLVLVGLATTGSEDPRGWTPDYFPGPFARWGHGYTAGVEIHANAIESLLAGDAIAKFPSWVTGVAGIVTALSFGFVFSRMRLATGAALYAAVMVIVFAAIYFLFRYEAAFFAPATVIIPTTAAYVLSPFVHYLEQRKQRQFIERAFSTYLSEPVVKQLIQNPDQLQLGGKMVEATVMFLDIAGFTTLAERYQPSELIEIMNRYLNGITECVHEYGGTIDKFIGDAVMAVWGAPIEDPEHASNACMASLAIQKKLVELAVAEVEKTGERIVARIGVNSGRVVAGNVGGSERFDYTVLGNDVNVASRLESINKVYGTDILIGESTAGLISDAFAVREIDRVRVKGKKHPITIHELQGLSASLGLNRECSNTLYARGLEAYRDRRWSAALGAFECVVSRGDDGPSEEMMERCQAYRVDPPEASWGGVHDMLSK